MIHQRWFEYGSAFGMRYLFDERGEGLAMHSHPAEQEHNVIVLRGSIQVTGGNPDGSISVGIPVKAPAIIEILPEMHELTALEPGTELLNLYKNGKPADYAAMAESEKHTVFKTRALSNPI